MRTKKLEYIVWMGVVMLLLLVVFYFVNTKSARYRDDKETLAKGKQLFNSRCSSCHSIADDGMGPRLGGITSIISEESLIMFVKDPAAVINSGDARAISLQKKYRQTMPAFDFIESEDLRTILAYIDHESKLQNIVSLVVDTTGNADADMPKERYAPPVKQSKLVIELDDYIKIPRRDSNPPDKGIATLRAHPSGNGILFISDQMGVIFRLEKEKADTFLNVRETIRDFIFTPGIGTGLGSFAFHPDFLHNGLFYTTHAEGFTGKSGDFLMPDTFSTGLQWVLSEWKMSNINQKIFNGTRRELIRINMPTTAHGVQDIGFAPITDKNNPDYGKLYLGIGDGGSNNIKHPELGHNKKSLLGSVLRIDPFGRNSTNGQYGIPPDNPFAKEKDPAVRKEIWANGFRNPHRLAWDVKNNRMLVADIGESNIEELNVVRKGYDYGWPVREGNYGIATVQDLKKVFPVSDAERSQYKLPFAAYDHVDGNAISGGFVYQGKLEALKNKYVFGDIVTGRIFYVNIDSKLSDSSIYEISIEANKQSTNLKQLNNLKRVHLRIGYDVYANELYLMTKNGFLRKVTNAHFKQVK